MLKWPIGAMLNMVPDETTDTPVLKSFDLSGAIEYMANCSNIIVMTPKSRAHIYIGFFSCIWQTT